MSGVVVRPRGFEVLAWGAAASSVTGTTNETTLATIAIPAGAMGPRGILRIQSEWTCTSSANLKTLQLKFGGTVYLFTQVTTTAVFSDQRIIFNNASVSAQKGKSAAGMTAGGWGVATNAAVTSTIDTASAANLTWHGTLANTGETISLNAYLVEILRG